MPRVNWHERTQENSNSTEHQRLRWLSKILPDTKGPQSSCSPLYIKPGFWLQKSVPTTVGVDFRVQTALTLIWFWSFGLPPVPPHRTGPSPRPTRGCGTWGESSSTTALRSRCGPLPASPPRNSVGRRCSSKYPSGRLGSGYLQASY